MLWKNKSKQWDSGEVGSITRKGSQGRHLWLRCRPERSEGASYAKVWGRTLQAQERIDRRELKREQTGHVVGAERAPRRGTGVEVRLVGKGKITQGFAGRGKKCELTPVHGWTCAWSDKWWQQGGKVPKVTLKVKTGLMTGGRWTAQEERRSSSVPFQDRD